MLRNLCSGSSSRLSKDVRNFAASWLWPYYCVLCDSRSDQPIDLCSACQKVLPWQTDSCFRCALPIQGAADSFCGVCLKSPALSFDRIIAAFDYGWPVDYLITRFKFKEKLHIGKILAALFLQRIAQVMKSEPDFKLPKMIMPVPLHSERLKKRGFNQALEIAKPLAAYFQIPLARDSLRRIRATEPQTKLDAEQRHQNLQKAFMPQMQVFPSSIAIIDDVVTTSATVTEVAKNLREAGVEDIQVWCLARRE